MNLVVCPYCNRHLRVKQEIQDAKLKCRFCGAIFAGSAQSAESITANTPPARQKHPQPVRYARVYRQIPANDHPEIEVIETPNPGIAKRDDIEIPQQGRPAIAALRAETAVCSSPAKPKLSEAITVEQTNTIPENSEGHTKLDTQPAVKPDVISNIPSETPEPMNNQQLTPKSQTIKTQVVEEPVLEIPVVVTSKETAKNSAGVTSTTQLRLKWIIASMIFVLAVGVACLVIIKGVSQ